MSKDSFLKSMKTLFRFQEQSALFSHMFICAFVTVLPIVIGEDLGSLLGAIYGALFGYLMTLIEPIGGGVRRASINVATYGMLLLGLWVGTSLQNHFMAFSIVVFVGSYALGLWAGEGEDIERLFLNMMIVLIASYYMNHYGSQVVAIAGSYGLIVLIGVIFSVIAQYYFHKMKDIPIAQAQKSIRGIFMHPVKRRLRDHSYAFVYAFTAFLSVYFVNIFQVERGYWVVLIFMILMKQSKMLSFYRMIQRFFGTCLSVIFVDIFMIYFHEVSIVAFAVAICAFLSPWAVKKNYWFFTFIVSTLVLLLLDLAWVKTGNLSLPFLRLRATFYGCFFTLFGILAVMMVEKVIDLFSLDKKYDSV